MLMTDHGDDPHAIKSSMDIRHHRHLHHHADMRPNHSAPPRPCRLPPTAIHAAPPHWDVWSRTRIEGRAGRECRLSAVHDPVVVAEARRAQDHPGRIRRGVGFAVREIGAVLAARRRRVCVWAFI